MSKVTYTRLKDDIDDTDADETVNFSLRGAHYEIDLHAKNIAGLEKALEPYISKARKVAARRSAPAKKAATAVPGASLEDIRSWAHAEGLEVSDRGRIPKAIADAYRAAHRPGGAPAKKAPAKKAAAKAPAKKVAAKKAAPAKKAAAKAPAKKAAVAPPVPAADSTVTPSAETATA